MNEMAVVFLDVDGVLNTRRTCERTPSGLYYGVDPARVEILAKAMAETRTDGVVFTTTWKDLSADDEDYVYLVGRLAEQGVKVLGKTEEEKVTHREDGILEYLERHKEIEDFVILDDQEFHFEDYSKLWERFLNTQARGIEYAVHASETPSISAIDFLDAIRKYSK